jgi:hypothetical protein
MRHERHSNGAESTGVASAQNYMGLEIAWKILT